MSSRLGVFGNHIVKKAKDNNIPLIGQFELTSRCNLSCRMCYVCKSAHDKEIIEKELTLKQWIKIAEEARDAGLFVLSLTGGEPMIRSDFKELYTELNQMGFLISLNSNGTTITPEVAKWLAKNPPSKVLISLYGSSPEMYQKVCNNANGFSLARRGIELLLNEGVSVAARYTLIEDNYGAYEEIADWCAPLGLTVGVCHLISGNRCSSTGEPFNVRVSPEKLIQFETDLSAYFKTLPGKFKAKDLTEQEIKDNLYKEGDVVFYNKDTTLLTDTNEKTVVESSDQCAFHCIAGTASYAITWEGKMTPCVLLDEPYAYPLEVGFKAAHEHLIAERNKITFCPDCFKCPDFEDCIVCPARLKSDTGSFYEKSEYICEYVRLYKEKKLRPNPLLDNI